MNIDQIDTNDIITSFSYEQTTLKEAENISIAYVDGEVVPLCYDNVEEKYFINEEISQKILDIIGLEKEPYLRISRSYGEKIGSVDMKSLMPHLPKSQKKFERVLKKVMGIMQTAYPDVNAEFLKSNLPKLRYKNEDEEFCAGLYDTKDNEIIACEDTLDFYEGFQTIFHESIHMATTRSYYEEIKDDKKEFVCGFHSDNGWGRGINEGITEYLTEETVGTNGSYEFERKLVKMLFAVGNKDEILKRYFEGDLTVLEDLFGSEDKAKKFITCVDVMSNLQDEIIGQFTEQSVDERDKMILDIKDEKEFNEMSYDEILNLEFAAEDKTKEKFEFEIYDIKAIADAQDLLLDLYKEKLDALDEIEDNDAKKKLIFEFRKNFITTQFIESRNSFDVLENGIVSVRYLDTALHKQIDDRFESITSRHITSEELYDIDLDVLFEHNEDIYVEDEDYEDFLNEEL